MTTITVHMPDDTPVSALRALADDIACDLRLLGDGSYLFRPRHSNNVAPLAPRNHNTIPPTGGEAA